MTRLYFLMLICSTVYGQQDTVRYDRWIGWVTPTSGIHVYHPAIEIGAEYNPGKQWAYLWHYGIQVGNKKDQYYEDQNHQYLRFGVKRYFAPKFNTGYIMPEVGIFHLSHKGTFGNVVWNKDPDRIQQANAHFHDFYLKTGVLLGRKMKAGDIRFDIFAGAGFRFTFRNHLLKEMLDYDADWQPDERAKQFMSDEIIYIDSQSGWETLKSMHYLSLGIRLGIGFKPVVKPKS